MKQKESEKVRIRNPVNTKMSSLLYAGYLLSHKQTANNSA